MAAKDKIISFTTEQPLRVLRAFQTQQNKALALGFQAPRLASRGRKQEVCHRGTGKPAASASQAQGLALASSPVQCWPTEIGRGPQTHAAEETLNLVVAA